MSANIAEGLYGGKDGARGVSGSDAIEDLINPARLAGQVRISSDNSAHVLPLPMLDDRSPKTLEATLMTDN